MHILTHSVINTHARTTTTDGGRRCSRWLTHYRERVAERRKKVKKTLQQQPMGGNLFTSFALFALALYLPLSQPYWFIGLVCLAF